MNVLVLEGLIMVRLGDVTPRCLLASIAFLTMTGCASSADAGGGAPPEGGGTPLTHTESSSEEALIEGTLGGDASCLWLEVDGRRYSLILPSGSTTRVDEQGVVLVDPQRQEIALEGERMVVTGGFRKGEHACPNTEQSVIVAGQVVAAEETATE